MPLVVSTSKPDSYPEAVDERPHRASPSGCETEKQLLGVALVFGYKTTGVRLAKSKGSVEHGSAVNLHSVGRSGPAFGAPKLNPIWYRPKDPLLLLAV